MRYLIILLLLVSCGTEPDDPFRIDLTPVVEKGTSVYFLYAKARPNKDIFIEDCEGGMTTLDVLIKGNTTFEINLDVSFNDDFEGVYDITIYGIVDGSKITYDTWVSP